jgi:transposase
MQEGDAHALSRVRDSLDAQVIERYREGRSIRQIAGELHVGRARVAGVLVAEGIEVRPRGQGRPRPGRRLPVPSGVREQLLELYVSRRLTRAQVATELGVSESRVRSWLARSGIRTRSRGRANPEDRTRVAAPILEVLYADRGYTAGQVAQHVGVERQGVFASLHEAAIAVRVPNAERRTSYVLLEQLYADAQIRRALARHGVPVVPKPGALRSRFPTPVPTTSTLLRDLYQECGASATQIELLTGHPAASVRRQLRNAGICMRPPGGLSPFMRRSRGLPSSAGVPHSISGPR